MTFFDGGRYCLSVHRTLSYKCIQNFVLSLKTAVLGERKIYYHMLNFISTEK